VKGTPHRVPVQPQLQTPKSDSRLSIGVGHTFLKFAEQQVIPR
jgi:hypothetical protein